MPDEFTNTVASQLSKRGKKKQDKTPGLVVSEALNDEEAAQRANDLAEIEKAKDETRPEVHAAVDLLDKAKEHILAGDVVAAQAEADEATEMTNKIFAEGRVKFLARAKVFLFAHENAARLNGRRHIANDLKAISDMLKQFEKRTNAVEYWKAE